MSDTLTHLFSPQSIAVVGASDHEGKPGNIIVKQLLGKGFRVLPVSTKESAVRGVPAYRSIRDVPEVPDVAVLAIPAEAAVAATGDCVSAGVPVVIVVAGGFGETCSSDGRASEAGRALEERLRAIVSGSRTRVLGPNTLGVLVPRTGLDTVFLDPSRFRRPRPGAGTLISQSGSAMLVGMDAAAFYGVGLAAFVGLGNRLDIDENELLEYFASDPATSAIGLYLESFADAPGFVRVCREVVPRKPVALLRAGRSAAGARAVQLHTGSLAGSDRVTDGVLRQLGVIRVFDEEELIDATRTLAAAPPLAGRRVAVLTNGGGIGVIAADYVESQGRGIASSLASLSDETLSRLAKAALPFSAVRNPIDLTASCVNDTYDAALGILQDDPGVDVILCCALFQPPGVDEGLNEILCHWGREGHKPLIVTAIGSETAIQCIRTLESAGVVAFPSVWRAVRAIDVLARRGEFLRRESPRRPADEAGWRGRPTIRSRAGTPLAEDEVKTILRDYGLVTPTSVVLPEGLPPSDLPFNYPVVVKVRSATIAHKTELGGVVLGIRDRAELKAAVNEMRSRFPGEDLLVEQMVPQGVEIIVGLIDDPTFGPSIMCGAGGVLAELYRDVSFRAIPIERADAEEMLGELKVDALLRGFRGTRASREAVVDVLLRVSRLGRDLSGLLDQMDLNPVIVHEDGAVVVDAKLVWKPESRLGLPTMVKGGGEAS